MSRKGETEIEALKRSLRRIAEAQAEFWDAMSEFEKLSGVALTSSNHDFTQFAEPTNQDVLWVMKNCVDDATAIE